MSKGSNFQDYWLLSLWRSHSCLQRTDRQKSSSRDAGNRFGDEERRLMLQVPAPAVRLMKSRVLSRPGGESVLALGKRIMYEVNGWRLFTHVTGLQSRLLINPSNHQLVTGSRCVDLFIKVLRVLCPNLTDASPEWILRVTALHQLLETRARELPSTCKPARVGNFYRIGGKTWLMSTLMIQT